MESIKAIQQHAIQLLSRREYSARELQRKLESDHDAVEVSEVLEQLQQQGLQSDDRFAELWTRHRLMQGYGPMRLQMEMRQKGLANDLIQQCLQADGIDWFEQAKATYSRKFGNRPARDQKEKAKQMRFLQYRGFTSDQIRYALENTD